MFSSDSLAFLLLNLYTIDLYAAMTINGERKHIFLETVER